MTSLEEEPATTADLLFREQEDGRKVSRLPNGKIVLVALDYVDHVGHRERWSVELEHRDNFAIAVPVERLELEPEPEIAMIEGIDRRRAQAEYLPTEPVAEPSKVLSKTDRVALFIHGSHTDRSARDVGYFLDFGRVRDYFTGPAKRYAAYFYVADYTSIDETQVRFVDFLSYVGYVVRRKAVKKIEDRETGDTLYKANMDIDLAVDAMATVDHYDVAFLFSGDGAYARLVEHLRGLGKRVYVVTNRNSLSRELAYASDKPVFLLDDHQEALERPDRSPSDIGED